ncbi:MAG: class D sortase [Ruminococcus sp.]|nr:class D sortase [Ruminococcus sp.]
MKKINKKSLVLHIVTPLLLGAVCVGVTALAAVKPVDKLKVYANIAFMDSLKTDPGSGSGLVIVDNDIISNYSGATSENGDVIRPALGELYALISSDALELDVPVYWGSTTELLERGACQASGSAVLGTEGNTVISAHVDTFFAELDKLKAGDKITLSTNYGQFTYTVSELISFNSGNKKYIVPTEDTRLTLYTCKRDILGGSDQRIGVVCELTEKRFYTEKEDAE